MFYSFSMTTHTETVYTFCMQKIVKDVYNWCTQSIHFVHINSDLQEVYIIKIMYTICIKIHAECICK